MWLIPPDQATAGESVEVVVSVGMDFPTSLHAIELERVTAGVISPESVGVQPTLRRDEEALRATASFTPDREGAWLVFASTAPKRLDQTAAKFNDYLLHDGLPHVLAGRMDRGELDRDANELYSKFIKTVVPVGDAAGGDTARMVVGHTLEIVPLADPLSVGVGETLRVRVLFQNKPLERGNLCWDHAGNGEDFTGQTWTDAKGEALVPIGKQGLMTLRLVHMTRPMLDEIEWESFWASYTFRVD